MWSHTVVNTWETTHSTWQLPASFNKLFDVIQSWTAAATNQRQINSQIWNYWIRIEFQLFFLGGGLLGRFIPSIQCGWWEWNELTNHDFNAHRVMITNELISKKLMVNVVLLMLFIIFWAVCCTRWPPRSIKVWQRCQHRPYHLPRRCSGRWPWCVTSLLPSGRILAAIVHVARFFDDPYGRLTLMIND